MLSRLKTRPSPALVISLIALFVSLGGAGYAAVTVTGKDVKNSSLTGKDVKNSSLTGKDVKNSSLGGKHVKNGSLAGADIKGDSLTGNQILESQLGKVPSATTADQAGTAGSATSAGSVGGVRLKAFNFAVPGPAAPVQEVLNFGGLVLSAGCAGALLSFTAATTVNDAELGSYSVQSDTTTQPPQNNAYDGDFDTGDSANLVPTDEDEEIGSLRYSKADGGGVVVEWHAYGGLNSGSNACKVSGVASAF